MTAPLENCFLNTVIAWAIKKMQVTSATTGGGTFRRGKMVSDIKVPGPCSGKGSYDSFSEMNVLDMWDKAL